MGDKHPGQFPRYDSLQWNHLDQFGVPTGDDEEILETYSDGDELARMSKATSSVPVPGNSFEGLVIRRSFTRSRAQTDAAPYGKVAGRAHCGPVLNSSKGDIQPAHAWMHVLQRGGAVALAGACRTAGQHDLRTFVYVAH